MKRLFILTLAMLSLSAWAQRDKMYPVRVSAEPADSIEEGRWYVVKNRYSQKFLSTNGGLVSSVDVNSPTELWRFEKGGTASDYATSPEKIKEYWYILTATKGTDSCYWKHVDYTSKEWDKGNPYDGYDWYGYAGFNGEFGGLADAQGVFVGTWKLPGSSLTEFFFHPIERMVGSNGKFYYLDCQPPNVAFSPWQEKHYWILYEVFPESEVNLMTVVNKDGTKTTNSGYDIVFNDNGDGTYSWGYADDTQQHWLGDIANVQEIRPAYTFSGNEVLVNDQNWSVGGETVDYSEAGTIWLYVGDKDSGRAFTGYSWLTWSSGNSRVATVEALPNGDGYLDYLRAKVTVEGPGTTYITATDEAGNEIKYQLSVVNRHTFPANAVLVEADNYDVGSATVNIADRQTVTLYIGDRSNGQPYAPFSWATWSVSNPEVASIVSTGTSSNNHITLKLLDDGETTITASNEDGRDKISFNLTVTRPDINNFKMEAADRE